MTSYEKPARGRTWRTNAAAYERNRCACLEMADDAERRNDPEAAQKYRGAAERWRLRRDEEQRLALEREFKARTFRKW